MFHQMQSIQSQPQHGEGLFKFEKRTLSLLDLNFSISKDIFSQADCHPPYGRLFLAIIPIRLGNLCKCQAQIRFIFYVLQLSKVVQLFRMLEQIFLKVTTFILSQAIHSKEHWPFF